MPSGSLRLTYRVVELKHSVPFRISRSTLESFRVVEVAISLAGETGYGEAAPHEHYGETSDSVASFLDDAAGMLGDDPFARDEIEARVSSLGDEMAARAGVDAALHDLCGKLTGLPVWRLIGTPRHGPATTMTLGLEEPDAMARAASAWTADGRIRRLKLKLGGGDGLDVERVEAVRDVTPVPLLVDVNESWDFAEALETIPRLASLGVECVEQPLKAGDTEAAVLKRESTLPIYADEDCHTSADLIACARIADGVNVKLSKCGGLRNALAMVHAARALGLGVMVGCMSESSLGIAAACPLAGLCDTVDLDTNLMLGNDPWQGLEMIDGAQTPGPRPGLGVERAPAARAT